MNAEIILHTGTEKTGSTALQEHFSLNRKQLLERGILYPASIGEKNHLALTACCVNFMEKHPILEVFKIRNREEHAIFISDTVSKLKSEIQKTSPKKILISDEHINVHLKKIEERDRLSSILKQFGRIAEIVIYLRRQDHLLTAMMSEAIKNKLFNIYNLYSPMHTFKIIPYRFSYTEIIKNLKMSFPEARIHARPFKETENFDVINDLNEIVKDLSWASTRSELRANTSIPAGIIKPLAIIGSYCQKSGIGSILDDWRNFVTDISSESKQHQEILDPEERLIFLEKFKSENNELKRIYPEISQTFDNADEEISRTNFDRTDFIKKESAWNTIRKIPRIIDNNELKPLLEAENDNERISKSYSDEVLTKWKRIIEQSFDSDQESMLRIVETLTRNGDWHQAIKIFERIEKSRITISATLQASRAYESINMIDQAQLLVSEINSIHKNNPWIILRSAELKIREKHYSDALNELSSIKTPPPGVNRSAGRLMAGLYLLENAPEKAKPCMEVFIDPIGNKKVGNFFRDTFHLRKRTNSLLSDPFSELYSDTDTSKLIGSFIFEKMESGSPASLIRLGDGEGAVLNGTNKTLLGSTFSRDRNEELNEKTLDEIRKEIILSCKNSDILGLPREDMATENYYSAILHTQDAILENILSRKILLTDCHCHYTLNSFGILSEIVRRAEKVNFIGGRDIRSFIMKENPSTQLNWYKVPIQANQGAPEESPHYPNHYFEILSSLRVSIPGEVFFVAAGVLGKIYCNEIKKKGGIAIDIGAVADIWSNSFGTRAYIKKNSLMRPGIVNPRKETQQAN